jgi:predicted nucleotidyltransferase
MGAMDAKALSPEVMQERIREAAHVLVSFGATEVYVFGSYARGDATEYSDVDLAVRGLPDEVYYRAIGQAGNELPVELDVVALDEDSPFAQWLLRWEAMQRVA